MRQYASSPRKEKSWIREIRGERLQLIAESTIAAVPAREIEVKGKMEERTERESDKRRREMVDLLVLQRAKSWQNGAGFSRNT